MGKEILIVVTMLCATLLPCRAWGPEGHEIVGRIAELHLTPAAAKAVAELLNAGNTNAPLHLSDNAVANWPDAIRRERPESAPWHYVDIAFDADRYDPERDCLSHTGCVVTAISRFQQVLANHQTNTEARVEALKFLVHFVGDIHQPLHCAERHNDHGGNMVWVRWPGDEKASKLHAVWDEHLVQKCIRDSQLDTLAYADKLNRAVTNEADLVTGAPADWAWHSHRLAVTDVYATIPEYGRAHPLDDAYISRNQGIVAEQLTKAGLRLAALINAALKP